MRVLAIIAALLIFLFAFVLFLQQRPIVPVANAVARDWNGEAFWHEGWGQSGVHKGIDIFAKQGTPVIAAVAGLVIYQGTLSLGGQVVLVMGPGGLSHYYAHLDSTAVRPLQFVDQGELLGTVGTSGNASPDTPHLHYSVMRLLPDFDRYYSGENGLSRMFYLNPDLYLQAE